MHDHLIADIGKAILAAGLIGIPAYIFGIPLILAYLVAGVLLGPHLGFSWIQDSNSIGNISEIGLVLLMFILGLEINIKKLLQAGKAVLLSGAIQIGGCFLIGMIFYSSLALNHGSYQVLYLSVACALSSTLIVVKILSDQMDLDSLPSRITLGVLVLQDLFAIGFLALQPNLSDLSAAALFTSLSRVIVLVLVSWFLARFVLPKLFERASKQPELMLILAMAWCFGICGAADFLHLSLEMGALVAGISIATFPYHLDVAAKISSLRDFFITLFFVSLGLQIPFPTFETIQTATLIVGFVLVSRILTIFPTLYVLNYANRASLVPAINLSQVSELSLVVASIGITYKHIDISLMQSFVLAMAFTALLSSFTIPSAHGIFLRINGLLKKIGFADRVNAKSADSSSAEETSPTLLILGFYREASSFLYELKQQFTAEDLARVFVVDFNPEAHRELKRLGIACVYGDISSLDTLRSLQIQNVKTVVCTIPDKILKGTSNLKLVKNIKTLLPESNIVATAETLKGAAELYEMGASYVFLPRITGARHLVEMVERLRIDGAAPIRAEGLKLIENRTEVMP